MSASAMDTPHIGTQEWLDGAITHQFHKQVLAPTFLTTFQDDGEDWYLADDVCATRLENEVHSLAWAQERVALAMMCGSMGCVCKVDGVGVGWSSQPAQSESTATEALSLVCRKTRNVDSYGEVGFREAVVRMLCVSSTGRVEYTKGGRCRWRCALPRGVR